RRRARTRTAFSLLLRTTAACCLLTLLQWSALAEHKLQRSLLFKQSNATASSENPPSTVGFGSTEEPSILQTPTNPSTGLAAVSHKGTFELAQQSTFASSGV